jgi:hypothetical protein
MLRMHNHENALMWETVCSKYLLLLIFRPHVLETVYTSFELSVGV